MENVFEYSLRTLGAAVAVGCDTCDVGGVGYFVRGNSIGFAEHEAAAAFLPFKRLASLSGFTVSGIGLTTVKCIIERHGGRVWAESTPGKGATFNFTLT